jgi:peptide/nickel transport system substrate-binding protein
MLALYRSGRQADALAAYVAARRRLVDDIGVEPDAELRELHERILRQDPELRLRPARVRPPSSPAAEVSADRGPPVARAVRQRHVLLAAALALLAGGAVFAFTRLTGPHPPGIAGGAVGVIDAHTAAITNEYRLHFQPGAVAAGGGSVWVANPKAGTVSRIPRKGNEVPIIDVGRNPAGLAFGGGSLWVAGGDDGALARVDPTQNHTLSRVPIGNGLRGLAVGYGAVWAATALDGEVVRFDLASGRVVKHIPVGGHPVAVTIGDGSVWVVGEDSKLLVRIDPGSNQPLDVIAVGGGPDAVADGLGAVWVANRADGTVSRIDPATDRVTDTAPAGARARRAGDRRRRALGRRRRRSGAPHRSPQTRGQPPRPDRKQSRRAGRRRRRRLGNRPRSTGGAPRRDAAARLGTDREAGSRMGWLRRVLRRAHRPRLRRPARLSPGERRGRHAPGREPGRAGAGACRRRSQLHVPAAPGPSLLRRHARPRERLPRLDAAHARRGQTHLASAPLRRHRRGGELPALAEAMRPVARDRHRRPDGHDQPASAPARPGPVPVPCGGISAVLPAAAPPAPSLRRPIPGTGPYRVERIARGRRILSRNPYFRPHDGRPAGLADRIEVAVGHDDEGEVRAVERGQLDFAFVPRWPAPRLDALRTRVGARLQSAANVLTRYAWLNAHRRPFDDPRVRLALNLALDRRRVVEASGGPEAAAPTCQILPPGMPGYRPTCTFTVAPSAAGVWTAPDLARARRLVAASGRQRIRVDVWDAAFLESRGGPDRASAAEARLSQSRARLRRRLVRPPAASCRQRMDRRRAGDRGVPPGPRIVQASYVERQLSAPVRLRRDDAIDRAQAAGAPRPTPGGTSRR